MRERDSSIITDGYRGMPGMPDRLDKAQC
jgi:hypothetical protein